MSKEQNPMADAAESLNRALASAHKLQDMTAATERFENPQSVLAVAAEVSDFLAKKYGPRLDEQPVLDGLWLAMQMVGGPQRAAATLRYCGVNFVIR